MERRLAVIMAADIVGYGRLVGDDEMGTLSDWRRLRAEVVAPAVEEANGRIFKLTGDGWLAEFAGASAAVEAAMRIQAACRERNADLPEERRIRQRMGVNLGEVAVEDGDLYGDAVNVAARLEGLSPPEGVALSEAAWLAIPPAERAKFRDLGPVELKNVGREIRVYVSAGREDEDALAQPGGQRRATVAVLPFQNISGEPQDEPLADGLTEDVITTLARYGWLFVAARNSTFAYRGRAVDVREVGRDLGARYVVEGGVRRSGPRLRVSAQLIDAGTGNHVWADRYDRVIEDIFELQDEISQTIAARIEPEMANAERERARNRRTTHVGAWELHHRAMWHLWRFTREDSDIGRELFRQAMERDPDFAAPHAGLAYLQFYDCVNSFTSDRQATLAQAEAHVRRALELDPRDVQVRFVFGRILFATLNYDAAMREFRRAIEVAPGFAHLHHGLGFLHMHDGRCEEALPYFDRAIRLSPQDPHLVSFLLARAFAHLVLRDFERAVESAETAIEQPNTMIWPFVIRASALGHRGDPRAGGALADVSRRRPEVSTEWLRDSYFFARCRKDIEFLNEGLVKAGLEADP